MNDFPEDLISPDDPRFQGAQFLGDEARLWHVVNQSNYLRGATWHWSRWSERDATEYDPQTDKESPAVWDHDHCHFCYDTRFSERYDGDLRDGWTTSGPAGLPEAEQLPNYHWVCPDCFERYRHLFGWTTEVA